MDGPASPCVQTDFKKVRQAPSRFERLTISSLRFYRRYLTYANQLLRAKISGEPMPEEMPVTDETQQTLYLRKEDLGA